MTKVKKVKSRQEAEETEANGCKPEAMAAQVVAATASAEPAAQTEEKPRMVPGMIFLQ